MDSSLDVTGSYEFRQFYWAMVAIDDSDIEKSRSLIEFESRGKADRQMYNAHSS